jgi:RNA polymerase sigma-70 factor (ECF subfamily)
VVDKSSERSAAEEEVRYETFVLLLMEHAPRVRSFLRGLLPTWNDVEEVAQEASLIAWRKFDSFEEGTAFGGWLLTIARYEAMKYRRGMARSRLVFSDDIWDILADEACANEDPHIQRQHLDSCLGKLGVSKRDLMLKVHTHGVVMREEALQSGKSEQAFYKTIQRLRSVLRDCVLKSISAENA